MDKAISNKGVNYCGVCNQLYMEGDGKHKAMEIDNTGNRRIVALKCPWSGKKQLLFKLIIEEEV